MFATITPHGREARLMPSGPGVDHAQVKEAPERGCLSTESSGPSVLGGFVLLECMSHLPFLNVLWHHPVFKCISEANICFNNYVHISQ